MAKCVLVIDDEETVREPLRQFLEEAGYRVQAAENPTICQAVASDSSCPLKTPCFAILIVDFSMPKMNGLDFLEGRAKRHCKGATLPVALMSGCLPEGAGERLDIIGCTFFQKPVRLSSLLNWIESLPK